MVGIMDFLGGLGGLTGLEMFKRQTGALQGAAQPVTGFNPSEGMIDPSLLGGGGALQNAGGYGGWRALADFGAGMAKASGPSATPVSFGQALAGGNEAMQAGEDRALNRQKIMAEINSAGKQGFDLEKMAQQVMIKEKMGIPLDARDNAIKAAYDPFNTAKMQTITLPGGAIQQVPANRPVFGSPGGSPNSKPPQAQAITPQQRLEMLRRQRAQAMGQ